MREDGQLDSIQVGIHDLHLGAAHLHRKAGRVRQVSLYNMVLCCFVDLFISA